jgi:Uma2 family endonuclease
VTEGSVPRLPDLAVEVQSPRNTVKAMHDKAYYYLANGVKMVWLIFPRKQVVQTFTAEEHDLLTIDDMLTGGDLLPGFAMAVRDVFADPLENDDVT